MVNTTVVLPYNCDVKAFVYLTFYAVDNMPAGERPERMHPGGAYAFVASPFHMNQTPPLSNQPNLSVQITTSTSPM